MLQDAFPRLGRLWWILGAAICVGCGDGDRPTLVPATGKVLVGGQGATAGSIYFHSHPDNPVQIERASSLLQLDGSFAIKTFPYGDGVPPGKYRVTLSPELAARIKRPELGDAAKTPWDVEVPEAGLQDHVFEVR